MDPCVRPAGSHSADALSEEMLDRILQNILYSHAVRLALVAVIIRPVIGDSEFYTHSYLILYLRREKALLKNAGESTPRSPMWRTISVSQQRT